MKTLQVTLVIFLMSFRITDAQNPIPNSSFENWYYSAAGTIEANDWQSNNSSFAAWNVFPDSNAYSGILALGIKNISYTGNIYSGFPVMWHPATLTGYIMNDLLPGDSTVITVHIYYANALVDSGWHIIYYSTQLGFYAFTLTVSQNSFAADSAIISIIGGAQYSSAIAIDQLSFSFITEVPEERNKDASFFLYPNPVTAQLTINNEHLQINSVEIYDEARKGVYITEPGKRNHPSFIIDVSLLSKGIYFVNIITKSGEVITKKLINLK